jgi:hypothetical protein
MFSHSFICVGHKFAPSVFIYFKYKMGQIHEFKYISKPVPFNHGKSICGGYKTTKLVVVDLGPKSLLNGDFFKFFSFMYDI